MSSGLVFWFEFGVRENVWFSSPLISHIYLRHGVVVLAAAVVVVVAASLNVAAS